MTDDLPLSPQEQDDALAAEYVLGVLDLAERSRAEARLKQDAAFAATVAAWEQRLAGLNDEFAPVPAPNLLPQIEARLFPVAAKVPRRSFFGWFAGAAVAAALAIGALYLVPRVPAPEFVATLQAPDQPLVIAASYAAGEITVTRAGGPAAEAGRVYELWLIEGDSAPVSLGLIEGDVVTRPVARIPEGAVLAISLEPAGGSPTGAPTGPVLVTGVVEGA
ncbi:MAG: anti-sigma factor [Rhodobacteraceae bacterium]|jgi:anti-sigma-K factor RskA|nr:anti-sigma factor [Paracoccaceae bacterium]